MDQLTSSAIADTDNDGVFEVVDAWGEPLYLQWHQENLIADDLTANVWRSTDSFVGLSKEHTSVGFTNDWQYSKPVLPTQIRPLLISERLLKIDGFPADYESSHEFYEF